MSKQEYTRDDVVDIVEEFFGRTGIEHNFLTTQENIDGFVNWLVYKYDLPSKLTEDERTEIAQINHRYAEYSVDEQDGAASLYAVVETEDGGQVQLDLSPTPPSIEELPEEIENLWEGPAFPFMMTAADGEVRSFTSWQQIADDFTKSCFYGEFEELDIDPFAYAWMSYITDMDAKSVRDFLDDPKTKKRVFEKLRCLNGGLDLNEGDLFYFDPKDATIATYDLFDFENPPFDLYAERITNAINESQEQMSSKEAIELTKHDVWRLPSRNEVLEEFKKSTEIKSMWSDFPYCLAKNLFSLVAPVQIRDVEDLMTYVVCDIMGSFTLELIDDCRAANPAEYVAYEIVTMLRLYSPKKLLLVRAGNTITSNVFARMLAKRQAIGFNYIEPESPRKKDKDRSKGYKSTAGSNNERNDSRPTIWDRMMGRA